VSVTDPQSPKVLRVDPCRSKVFSFLEWRESAEEIRDEATNRLIRPEGPTLHVRYRGNGSEWEFYPVSESEFLALSNPGPIYDYSVGKAFGSIIKAYKSSRQLKSGQRQETVKQREEAEQRAGRRWLV
jgi:hypothetical protein